MPDPVGQESSAVESLSPYAAPYVTEMLGRGQALASTPYQAYTGPLTAGPSQLQQQAFGGLGSLALPAASAAGSLTGAAYQPLSPQQIAGGETPQPYAGGPTSPVQAYMNPYHLLRNLDLASCRPVRLLVLVASDSLLRLHILLLLDRQECRIWMLLLPEL